MNKGCTPISAKNRTNQASTRGKINAPRVKKHGAYIHLPFEPPPLCHEKSERRNCRSCGQSLEAKARLNVLLLLIIIIIIIVLSLFCFTACLVFFSLSLPTVHSPGEVPFTKQKIASQRRKNHLPEALLELFQPIKNKPFLKDWHEYRIYANLGEKELYLCV